MGTTEIYLLRHGETEWNASGRFQGILNSPLTVKGMTEAQQCGHKLAPIASGFDEVVVSPLGRTRQTSSIIRSLAGLPPERLDARLQEVSMGSWDGLTHTDIDACWPGALDGSTAFDWYFRSPDGERYEAATARARDWLSERSGTTLAITHGLMSRIIRGAYLGLSEEDVLRLPVSQGVIWRLAEGSVTTI